MREKVEEGRSREVLLGEMSTLLIYAFWTATAPPFCPSLVGHCTGEATAEEATGNHGKKGRTEFGARHQNYVSSTRGKEKDIV